VGAGEEGGAKEEEWCRGAGRREGTGELEDLRSKRQRSGGGEVAVESERASAEDTERPKEGAKEEAEKATGGSEVLNLEIAPQNFQRDQWGSVA
jgi:hypothetical protein